MPPHFFFGAALETSAVLATMSNLPTLLAQAGGTGSEFRRLFFVGISFLRLLNSGNSCEFRAAEPGKSHSDRPNPGVDESFEHHFASHALILSKSRPKLASISEAFPRYARNSHLFPKFSFAMLETHIYFYREAKSGKHILSRKQNTPALPQRHELALGSNLSTQAEPRSNYSVASSASTTATASSAASARSAASATSAASSASSSSR